MPKFPEDINESKAIHISLVTGLFVVALLIFLEFIYDILGLYTSITPALTKLATLGVFALVIRKVVRDHRFVLKIE